MKTKNILFAAFITVVAPIFFTSCINEEKDELDQMSYEYNQKKKSQNKQLETVAEIAENIADLYDLKVTYEMDGRTVVEDLKDMNVTETFTHRTPFGEPRIVNVKQFGFSKYVGKNSINMTITATPKADAIAKVEAMPEDARFDFVIYSKTKCKTICDAFHRNSNDQLSTNVSKTLLMKRLMAGDCTLEKAQCK